MINENYNPDSIKLLVPVGHYYSPIADPVDIKSREEVIWAPRNEMSGIDLRIDHQLNLLQQLGPFLKGISYPIDEPKDSTVYFYTNGQYPAVDAEFLHAALCYYKPKCMIEVGSGFSSLVTAEVNNRILNNQIDFICIEPYPRKFLLDGVNGITNLVQQKVEDVDLAFFQKLHDGDMLFIDSSHVSKVGSDVNFLYFEVLPRLAEGVIVHIHDIFLPDEYPKPWVFEGWNWNEQYLLRAFLHNNAAWEVLWAANYMCTRHGDVIKENFPRFPELGGGASIWLRKKKSEISLSSE